MGWGPASSDSKQQTVTNQSDQRNTAADQAVIYAPRYSVQKKGSISIGNTAYNLAAGAQFSTTSNTVVGYQPDDLRDLLAHSNQNTIDALDERATTISFQQAAQKRAAQNGEYAQQLLDTTGPKATQRWILFALVAVTFVAVGSVFWHHGKGK